MAIQKKSLISSSTIEKKSATKQQTSVGEPKSLSAKAMRGQRLKIATKRNAHTAMRTLKK